MAKTDADKMRDNHYKRTGKITPMTAPMTGEPVYDEDRGYGVVTRTAKGAACWVKFPDSDEETYYSLRAALGRWLAFPGPAGAQGLRALEV